MSTSTPARANGRRRRAWSLDCLALGLYAAPNPRRLMHVDVPLLLSASVGGEDTPARRKAIGRHAIAALREMGCRWPIVVRYQGVAGRQ